MLPDDYIWKMKHDLAETEAETESRILLDFIRPDEETPP
jgi:hypothetical protein